MSVKTDQSVILVFDLDDTLYKECTYTQSCFEFVSGQITKRTGAPCDSTFFYSRQDSGDSNPIQSVCQDAGLSHEVFSQIVDAMRAHAPSISLCADTLLFLQTLRQQSIPFAIITDGRSVTQRAKIEALGVFDAELILVSEERGVGKPDEMAFLPVQDHFGAEHYFYIADNPQKDFLAPNRLGWTTVMLVDDGRNIHPQNIDVPLHYQAVHQVHSFRDLAKMSKIQKLLVTG